VAVEAIVAEDGSDVLVISDFLRAVFTGSLGGLFAKNGCQGDNQKSKRRCEF